MVPLDGHSTRRLARIGLVVMAAIGSVHPACADEAGPGKRQVGGSVFLVGQDGYLVTNAHVVATCQDPYYVNGRSREPVKVVLIDPGLDVAVLFGPTLAHTGGLALRTDVKVGGHVTVFGYPLAPGLAERGRATVGILLGLSNDRQRLMTNAHVQAGNSGGPIFDQTGAVVGMTYGKTVNRTYAISAPALQDMLEKARVKPPIAGDGAVLAVADVLATARRFTGKMDCKG